MKIEDENLRIPVLEDGEKLYHYTSAEGVMGICTEGFYATERGFLNDPSEFQVATDVFCDVLDEHLSDKYLKERITSRIRKEIDDLQDPDLEGRYLYSGDYIISFSLEGDSPLMWSSYSDYKGYCIRFDFNRLEKAFEQDVLHLHGKVIYDYNKQYELLVSFIEEQIFNPAKAVFEGVSSWDDLRGLDEGQEKGLLSIISISVSIYNMFFKKKSFEGENEYRFVFMENHERASKDARPLKKQQFRVRNDCIIPYVQAGVNIVDAVEEVLVGTKNTTDIATTGLRHFFRNMNKNVDVVRSDISLRY